MDSMALYRGMDIGTAKPGPDERRRVPHHLLDVLDPWESASVAWWLDGPPTAAATSKAAAGASSSSAARRSTSRRCCTACSTGRRPTTDLRRRLTEEAERLGSAALHARLAAVDPASAARLHPNDVRRVIRALEVWRADRPADQRLANAMARAARSSLAHCHRSRRSPCPVPRSAAAGTVRPHRRPRRPMIADGLVEEVRALRRLPRPLSREAAQALGYKEMFDHLDGRIDAGRSRRPHPDAQPATSPSGS